MVESVLLKWFSNLSKESVGEAGGKGASLGEMTRAGIPVPNGYVILASSFEKFLDETDLNVEIDSILEKVNHKEMQSIENASEEIKALIMNAKMPKDIASEIVASFKKLNSTFVAVRSSATSEDSSSAAWAGQLDSFLNTKADTLLENVNKCWASLFTPRAIFYRFEKGLHDTKISVAVVVQKMVNSEISGIAFSVHPVTQDRNQLIIEAGLGLGEAIVSGQITPDSYVIEKNPRRIIDKNISEQERGLFKVETGGNEWKENLPRGKEQKLSDKQIMELSEIILGIEKHYAFPCDIEWAFENGKFFIVQSRPITTLTDKSNDKEMPSVVKGKESEKKKEIKSKKKEVEGNDLIWAKNYLESNEFDIKEARIAIPVAEIVFSIYAKPNRFGDEYDPVFIPHINQKAKQILHLEKYKTLERHAWDEAIKNKNKFISVLKEASKIQKKINSISISEDKLYKLSSKKLQAYFKELIKLIKEWWKYGSIAEDKGLVVEEKIVPLMMKNHAITGTLAFDYVSDMTTPLKLSIFSKERMTFLDLCIKAKTNSKLIEKRNKKYFLELNKYSKKYFYARTSFYETVSLNEGNLVKLIKDTIENNSIDSLREEYTKLANGMKHLKEKQKLHKKLFTSTKEEKDYLWYFTIMHSWQDERKVSMMTHFNYFENILQEVSKRTGIEYDSIALMTLEEVEDLILEKKIDVKEIEKRKEGVFYIYKKDKVLRFYGEEAKELVNSIPSSVDSKEILKGAIASKGHTSTKIRGKVRIVHNPAKDIFNEGEVLVTTMTRPEFVPIMQKALAIVTDEGGLTSHAAIVSRELGIPCIIGTKVATQILVNGDLVEVDVENGIVKKLSESKDSSDSELKKNDNKKVNFKKFLSRKHAFLTDEIILSAWADKVRVQKLTGFEEYTKNLEIVDGDYYFDFNWFDKVETYYTNTDLEKFWNFINQGYEHGEKTRLYARKIKSNVSKSELIKEFNTSVDLLKNLLVFLPITHPLAKFIERKVIQILKNKGIGDDKLTDVLMEVSFPVKKNTSVLEQEDLFQINQKFSNNVSVLENALKKHTEKYGFLGYREPFSEGYSQDFFKSRLVEVKLPVKHHSNISFTKDEQKYVDLLKEFVYFRTYRTEKLYETLFFVESIWKKLAKEFNLTNETDFGWYSELEIQKLFKIKEKVSNIELENRRKGHALFLHNSEMKVLFAKEMFAYKKEKYSKISSSDGELKGVSACKGKVRGLAKLVFSSKDQSKINFGDILVTLMTTPDFLPAMNRASAFVTDEGGVTCHAAIVAREMNKPCIIGTKDATKVIKDGDLIEVDADSGIVRIIKSNESNEFKKNEDEKFNLTQYKKVYSRNFSVLRMQFLSDGAYYSIKELTKGKYFFTPLFIKSLDGVVDAYYDFSSPEQDPKRILLYLNENIPFVKEKFLEIKVICKKVDEIINKTDFSKTKFVFDSVKKIQPFSTLGKLIGEIPNPPKELFDIFAGFRFDYDGLMYRAENFLLEGAKRKGFLNSDYLTFEEIFNGSKVKYLEERRKGFAFFKGKIILLSDFDKFLLENNIALDDYKKENLVKYMVVRDRAIDFNPCYWNDVIQSSIDVENIYKKKLSVGFGFYAKGRMKIIKLYSDWEEVGEFIAKNMLSDSKYFLNIENKTNLAKKRIELFLKNNKLKDYSKLSEFELKNILLDVFELFIEYDSASVFSWYVAGDKFKSKVFSELGLSAEEFDLLSLPDERTFASQMEIDVLKASFEKNVKGEAKKLSEKYYWVSFGYDGPKILDENHFVLKLNELKKDLTLAKKEFSKLDVDYNTQRKMQNNILNKLKSNKYFTELVRRLHLITIWTDERKMLDFQLFYYYTKSLENLSKINGLTLKEMKYLTVEEIIKSKDYSSLKSIAQFRINNPVMDKSVDGVIEFVSDKKRNEIVNEIESQNKVKEITGSVASKGNKEKYIAKVKVALSPHQAVKIEDGEFLVALMTTPEYIFAMKKAVGFITDEGGVTCHAAIVAREMNKPCIIGAKIATKILADGDLIEVDIIKGIVRILK